MRQHRWAFMTHGILALFLAFLNASSVAAQDSEALREYLKTQPPVGSTSRSVDYRISYKSFREGRPKGEFKDSGALYVGTTLQGNAWASAPQHEYDPEIGEVAPPSEGKRWFNQAASPSKMAAFADPGSVLMRFVRRLQLKTVEPPSGGRGRPEDRVLIYPLEAPRPARKFWTFKMKAGEARLHVKKDGTPVSLEVVQAYEGKLSPHFGEYLFDRKETWTFLVNNGRLLTTKYVLSLHRRDWKDSVEASMEMTIGGFQ